MYSKEGGPSREENARMSPRCLTEGASGVLKEGTAGLASADHGGVLLTGAVLCCPVGQANQLFRAQDNVRSTCNR